MKVIKTILVAVDRSEYSLPVVQYAGRLAETVHAKLLVVTVINQLDINAIREALQSRDEALCSQIVSERISDCREWLNSLIRQAGAGGIKTESLVRQGVPHEELLKIITLARPDLMVMGNKGRSGLGDTLVGSCAQKLFRRCPVPLLSLRFGKPAATRKK